MVDMCERAKKRKNFFGKLVVYFKEYCNSTSIHGFRYFGEDRSFSEKIWWMLAFAACLTGCTLSILAVYSKWSSSPVIVTLANKAMPIHDIPFPAITVCPESKINANFINASKIYDACKTQDEDYLNKLGLITTHLMNYLVPMCRFEDNFTDWNVSENDAFYDIMEKVSPKFEISNCTLYSNFVDCSTLFSPIITDEGICFTFNILNRTELFTDDVIHQGNYHVNEETSTWDSEHGYSKHAELIAHPKRALLSGARYGIQFDLKLYKDDVDAFCRQSHEGFRVLLHSPLRFPIMSQQSMIAPYDQRISGIINPSMISTSRTVRKYGPEKRGCYFPDEKKLKFFKIYSAKNCALECLTKFTLVSCDCVDIYMPRFNDTRICGGADFQCLKESEFSYQVYVLRKAIATSDDLSDPFGDEIEKAMSQCDCLPLCTDLEYKVELSQSPWLWSKEFDDTNDFHLTRFNLYFASSDFIAYERNELYGPTDFLANFGGLLGLFTGFSILSFIEIIYFLTLRIVCNSRLYKNWSGSG